MEDGLQSRFVTHGVEGTDVTVSQKECITCRALDAGWERFVFAKLARGDGAFGAPAIVRARHKCLLWVVAHENGEDWVASAPDTIAAHHCDPCFTIRADRT